MNIVILGPSGQVGGMLSEEFASTDFPQTINVHTVGRTAADVEWSDGQLDSLSRILDTLNADVVINAIAYTAVDKAESEPEQAFQANSDLPSKLSDWCEANKALLIHFSTDFVFDGMKVGAWKEWDDVNPLSTYGKSKLSGEKCIQMSHASALILRTSWVYGETGNNFVKTMLRLGKEREVLGVVSDQMGCPTYSRDIAKATIKLIIQFQLNPERFVDKQQLYHLAGSGHTSWHGFADAIFTAARDYETLALTTLNAITTSDYPTPAVRPFNSVLDCSELANDYNIHIPNWETSLNECLKRLYLNEG